MTLQIITQPATEPVSLVEAKLHLKEDGSDNDTLITALIVAARQMAEHELGRVLITQTWEQVLDAFPAAEIELGCPPIISISSVAYITGIDAGTGDAINQTLPASAYSLDTVRIPGWLLPAYGASWPAALATINAVRIRFTCGYGAAAAVPQSIRQWMLVQIGHWYRNREAASADALAAVPYVSGLLDPWRVTWGRV